jgi:CheY-like chemotaxis protein
VPTILVVDDELMLCDLLKIELGNFGHEVITADNGREGIALFAHRRPDLTLLDLHMPGMNGIEVLTRIRELDPQASVIVLTGGGTDDLENQARELGVHEFLRKGLSLNVLVKALGKAMQQPGQT